MSSLFNSHISEMHNVCCLPSIFYMYRRSVSGEKLIAWVMTRWHPIINDSHTLYRSIVFRCQHANFHFLLLGCRQTVLRNQYRKKSARHVKVCWQSHLRNAQRSLLRCKQSFLNQTFRHNQQVAYNILKSMDQLFYKTSTKSVRTCIWKTLSKVYLSKTTRRRQQVAFNIVRSMDWLFSIINILSKRWTLHC